jgi:hypothetical protein
MAGEPRKLYVGSPEASWAPEDLETVKWLNQLVGSGVRLSNAQLFEKFDVAMAAKDGASASTAATRLFSMVSSVLVTQLVNLAWFLCVTREQLQSSTDKAITTLYQELERQDADQRAADTGTRH